MPCALCCTAYLRASRCTLRITDAAEAGIGRVLLRYIPGRVFCLLQLVGLADG
jgi:hypothetical protein